MFGTDGVPLRIERMGRHLIATGLLAEDALWVFDAESGRRIARARLNGASSAADQVTRIGRAVAEGVVSATHPKEDQVVLLGRFSGKMHLVNLASWTAIVRPLPVPMDARLRIDASSNGVSRLVWHRSATLGYVNVAASLERIYALYCGCTLADSSSARELHIFECGSPGKKIEALEDKPELPVAERGQSVPVERGDIHPVQKITATGGPVQTAEQIH